MEKLLVLCGPPGCGKTTLIEKFLQLHQDFIFVDIFQFVKKYKDENGDLGLNGSLLAHQDMYNFLGSVDKNIILELGTNRAELNFGNVARLSGKYKISVFFCRLDKEICIKRVLARQAADKTRNYPSLDYLAEKFKRGYPEKHTEIAQQLNLSFRQLDMSLPDKDLLDILENILS
ncbi:MAG: AAA family ATPase [Patescibacteria group bacterium]|jgi:uridine kinase